MCRWDEMPAVGSPQPAGADHWVCLENVQKRVPRNLRSCSVSTFLLGNKKGARLERRKWFSSP